MFDLAEFIDEKYAWSRRTFGEGQRTYGVLAHILKEVEEIHREPTNVIEWVDIILLAFDGASRAGYSGKEIVDTLLAKQMINLMREWPSEQMADHLPVEHIRQQPRIITPYDAGDL